MHDDDIKKKRIIYVLFFCVCLRFGYVFAHFHILLLFYGYLHCFENKICRAFFLRNNDNLQAVDIDGIFSTTNHVNWNLNRMNKKKGWKNTIKTYLKIISILVDHTMPDLIFEWWYKTHLSQPFVMCVLFFYDGKNLYGSGARR
jgi:hypothetical protein